METNEDLAGFYWMGPNGERVLWAKNNETCEHLDHLGLVRLNAPFYSKLRKGSRLHKGTILAMNEKGGQLIEDESWLLCVSSKMADLIAARESSDAPR